MIRKVLYKITDDIDFDNSSQTVSYLNIYNYQILRKQPEIVKAIDYFTLDGIMLVLFLRLFARKKLKRMAPDFSSYFQNLFAYFEDNNKKVVFLGGSEKDMERFVKVIRQHYPKLNIHSCFSGFNIDEKQIIKHLISNNIDATIVGMGTPKQEAFLINLKRSGYIGASFSCGAFISQTANKGKIYFPSIINKLHLRWLYRIYKEPKLLKRYLIDYPIGLKKLISDQVFAT